MCNYFVPMVTKIVSIGNSRGIRIPKAMLENCGFGEDAELVVRNGALVLRPLKATRAGWNEAFAGSGTSKEQVLHEDVPSTRFDEEEWAW